MYSCQICLRQVAIRSTIKSGPLKGKKVCPACRSKEVGFTTTQKKGIKKITERTAEKNRIRSQERSVYFEHHTPLVRFSEESGEAIYNPTRGNVCHILPKSSYPSVQTDLRNVVYLTLKEHELFDKLLMGMQFEKLEQNFPNCWNIVKLRFISILPECKEMGKLRVEFESYIKNKRPC